MNTDEQNTTPPPPPDPFETLAQTLANCAAMLVQCAGQIAALKKSQDATPPPPPAPAEQDETPPPAEEEPKPEPEQEPEEEPKAEDKPEAAQDEPEQDTEDEDSAEQEPPAESPENAEDEAEDAPEKPDTDKATDDQPAHEDGRGGEKDEPAEQEPEQTEEPKPENDEQTDSEAPGPQDEAETGDSEAEQEAEQPDADDLKESDKEGTGEEQEAENAPESDAQEQPADADDNNADPARSDEQQDSEQSEGEPQPGESEDAGESAPRTGNKGDDIENEDGTTQDVEPTEDTEDTEDDGTEAESETTTDSAEGTEDDEEQDDEAAGETAGDESESEESHDDDDDAPESPDFDEEDESEDDDGAPAEAAESPEHVDSDMELGDGSADTDTEQSGQKATDDGRGEAATLPPDLPPLDSTLASCTAPIPPAAAPYRPLTPIAMKCADMLCNALGKRFALQRPNRHTGQLSAAAVARHAPDVFRRRPRFDGKRPKLTIIMDTSTSMSMVHAKQGQHLLDGLLEAHRRRAIDLRLYDSYRAGARCTDNLRAVDQTGLFNEMLLKTRTTAQFYNADHAREIATIEGALCPDSGCEKFAAALQNLKPVILDSDATIIFTDGHWTDGSLDKVKYQCEGITVVGLYIPLEYEQMRELRASLNEQKPLEKNNPSKVAELRAAINEFESLLRQYLGAAQKAQAAYNALDVAEVTRDSPTIVRARKAYDVENTAKYKIENLAYDAIRKIGDITGRHLNLTTKMLGLTNQVAASAAMLEHNSHRSYAVETAVEAAAAIAQEITRQIESK